MRREARLPVRLGAVMQEKDRAQIEEALGRPLVDAELVVISDLSVMPDSHLDVMERLTERNGMAAIFYMRAVTDDIDPSTLRHYVYELDSVIAARNKPTTLRAQQLYENELGRRLTVEEMTPPGTLQGISEKQRALARELCDKDAGVAMAYLHDLAPAASTHERIEFLEKLPRG